MSHPPIQRSLPGVTWGDGQAQGRHLVTSLPDGVDTVVGDGVTAHLDSESEAAVQAALDAALVGRTSQIAHRQSTVRRRTARPPTPQSSSLSSTPA